MYICSADHYVRFRFIVLLYLVEVSVHCTIGYRIFYSPWVSVPCGTLISKIVHFKTNVQFSSHSLATHARVTHGIDLLQKPYQCLGQFGI